jgi:hypothetical protein
MKGSRNVAVYRILQATSISEREAELRREKKQRS